MGTLKITREKRFLGSAAALYCFVSDSFLDENGMSINYLANGKSVTLTPKSDIVAMKCRAGAFRQVTAPSFGEIYVIDFRKHPVVNAFISLKGTITFTDDKGQTISFGNLLDYANNCPFIAEKDWYDMMILYKSFVPTENFAPSKEYHGKLAVDEQRKRWAYFDNGVTLVNQPPYKNYAYSDIVSFELLENGSSVTKGGLGSAVIGGALLGDVGAVVGATTAAKTTTSICNSMEIVVTVKDKQYPNIYIPIIKSAISTSSKEYKELANNARDIMATLDRLCREGKSKNDTVIKKHENVDDLRKYKSLLDEGLITESDYESIKKKILNL